jgi:hypothetical protein
LDVFDDVGGLDFDSEGMGGAKVVGRREDELSSARAGGDADLVEKDDGFVDVNGIRLSHTEEGDAAANVPGEGLNVLERRHFNLA